jgi:hypothetical protein
MIRYRLAFARPVFAALLCAACALGHTAERDARDALRLTPPQKDKSVDFVPEGAAEDTTIEVLLGDQPITVPMPKGYVRLSALLPDYVEAMGKTLPPGGRIIEVLVDAQSEGGVAQYLDGKISYEMYGMATLELGGWTRKEWLEYSSEMASGLRGVDLTEATRTRVNRSNEVMDEMYDEPFRIDLNAIDRPQVYRRDDRTLRFLTVVKLNLNESGHTVAVDMARVVALVHVRNRILMVAADIGFERGKADVAVVRRSLDAYVDEILRLNPAQESASAPASDAKN